MANERSIKRRQKLNGMEMSVSKNEMCLTKLSESDGWRVLCGKETFNSRNKNMSEKTAPHKV